jgi:hypothetical protein
MLPPPIWDIIADYAQESVLRDEIKPYEDQLDLGNLNKNPDALDYLIKHPGKIRWEIYMNPNPRMKYWVSEKYDKGRTGIITLINQNESDWAMEFLQEHPEFIDVTLLKFTDHSFAVRTVYESSGINWSVVSKQSCDYAVKLMLSNPNDAIRTWDICENESTAILEYLRDSRPGKINTDYLMDNPNPIAHDLIKLYGGTNDWMCENKNVWCAESTCLANKTNVETHISVLNGVNVDAMGSMYKSIQDHLSQMKGLSKNSSDWAVDLLKKYPILINKDNVYKNTNPRMLDIILSTLTESRKISILSDNPIIFKCNIHDIRNVMYLIGRDYSTC